MSVKLKLIKGLSYRGGREGTLKATKDEPFCMVDTLEEAQDAVATGHFVIDGTIEEPQDDNIDPTLTPNTGSASKGIDKMTKDELTAYAEKLEVDISNAKNNEERMELIKKALEKPNAQVPFVEE